MKSNPISAYVGLCVQNGVVGGGRRCRYEMESRRVLFFPRKRIQWLKARIGIVCIFENCHSFLNLTREMELSNNQL